MAEIASVDDYEHNLQTLNIPLVDQEDKDDIVSSLSALSDTPDTEASTADAPTPPSKTALGDDDVKNIFYINFNPDKDKLTDQQRQSLNALQTNIDLNTNFLSLKSGSMTQQKIDAGQLPQDMNIDSQFARGSYRAKVTDYFIRNSSWIGIYANEIKDQTYTMEKKDFHAELLKDVLKGLTMPSSIFSKLEGVLTAISDSISNTTTTTKNKKMFWIMITLYKWESTMQVMRPTIRTIYFEATDDISTYTSKKKDVTKVDIKLGFAQGDYIFNNSIFEAGAKSSVQTLLGVSGAELVNKPIDIPVD